MRSIKTYFLWVVTTGKKSELVSYQLKDAVQNWYTQWRDNRAFRAGPIIWKVFRRALIDWFFPRETRDKVKEFINLYQEGISVIHYSFKFTKLYKYAPSLVSNLKNEMS